MEQHQEQQLRQKLAQLPPDQLADIKADAHAATHEQHPSFLSISKWVAGIFGTVTTTGLVIKSIKYIRSL